MLSKCHPHDPHHNSFKDSLEEVKLEAKACYQAILCSLSKCPDHLVHIIHLVHIVHPHDANFVDPHDHPVPHVLFKDSLEEIKLEANNISEIAPGTFFGLNHLR